MSTDIQKFAETLAERLSSAGENHHADIIAEYITAQQAAAIDYTRLIAELTPERDTLRSEVERLTKERDEARVRVAELEADTKTLQDMRAVYLNLGPKPQCICTIYYGGLGYEPNSKCPIHGVNARLPDKQLLVLFEAELNTSRTRVEACSKEISELRAKSAEHLAKLQAAEADAKRMDWLLQPENMRMRVTDENDGDWVCDRDDIDAAMKEAR